MGPPEFESGSLAPKSVQSIDDLLVTISPQDLEKYISLRKIAGVSQRWLYNVIYFIKRYLEYCNWIPSFDKTIEYLDIIRKKYYQAYFRKNTYADIIQNSSIVKAIEAIDRENAEQEMRAILHNNEVGSE